MTSKPTTDSLIFDQPARYQIRVLGRISELWSGRLEGMSINKDTGNENPAICALEGELLDQAALLGVINWLYELHLPILSVECLSYPFVSHKNK